MGRVLTREEWRRRKMLKTRVMVIMAGILFIAIIIVIIMLVVKI